jgi:hypothetical protein
MCSSENRFREITFPPEKEGRKERRKGEKGE